MPPVAFETVTVAGWTYPAGPILKINAVLFSVSDPGGDSWIDIGRLNSNGVWCDPYLTTSNATLKVYPYANTTSRSVSYDGFVIGRWK